MKETVMYIYNLSNQKEVKKIAVKSQEDFMADPKGYYPPWDKETNVSSEIRYTNPRVSKNEVREMTREELILEDDKVELLQDGEYIKDNKIITVPRPIEMYKPIWVKTSNWWQESATVQEIDVELDRLFSEYIFLVEQKEKYIKFKFPTQELDKKIEYNTLRKKELTKIKESL